MNVWNSNCEKKMVSDKKGTVVDAIPVMIYTLVFGLATVFGYMIYVNLGTAGFFTITNSLSNNATANLQQSGEYAFDALDYMGLFIFIGTGLTALMGALLIRTHPAFFFVSVLVLVLEVFIAVPLSNLWNAAISDSNFAAANAQFVMTGFVLNNLPVLVLAVIVLIAVVTYAINPFD